MKTKFTTKNCVGGFEVSTVDGGPQPLNRTYHLQEEFGTEYVRFGIVYGRGGGLVLRGGRVRAGRWW